MTTETTLAEVSRSFNAPAGYDNGSILRAHAKAYKLNGNQHPHFSVTGEIGTKRQLETGNWQCGGCIHEEIVKRWPTIAPIIALHLSNADDGEPMHAEANGYYWLAGVVGGLGEQYHGGNGSDGRSPEKCLSILADHLRISQDEAKQISDQVKNAYDGAFQSYEAPPTGPTLNRLDPWKGDRLKTASNTAKNVFHDFVNAQRDRWQREANEGIALIQSLAAEKTEGSADK